MENLNETLAEPLDADHMNRVMLERESILSDIGRLMRSLDMLKDRQKNADHIALESGLLSLRDQYVQTTDELVANASTLTRFEHDNSLLRDANMVLANEVASDTQLFDKNQRENASHMAELTTEKDRLMTQIEALQAVITVKESENQGLDQALDSLEQAKRCCAPSVAHDSVDAPLLIAQAEIADLFINLRVSTPTPEKEVATLRVALENS